MLQVDDKMHLSVLLGSIFMTFLLLEFKGKGNRVQEKNVIVKIKLGLVKGSRMETRLGKTIHAFRGIYYAEPPTGEFRFKDPIPIRPWSNVFDATKDGPACPQLKGINISENCLTLNIYTKKIPNNGDNLDKNLPVIVFLYPGSFVFGSAQSFVYGPKYLLDHDIVLVTLNYRLGALGFTNTGDLYSTGNYGFKDQVLALKFIRDHIASFGGDPRSVTLTGQSAGARSIILHLVSPMSKGLFHKTIGLSGSMTTLMPPMRQQNDLAVKQAKLLNCTTEIKDDMFKCLKEKTADDYGRTVPLISDWNICPLLKWYPAVEPDIPGIEKFLPDEPEVLMKLGKINQVPFIFGITTDEIGYVVAQAEKDAMEGVNTYFQEFTDRWYEIAPICFQYERNTEHSKFISDRIREFYFNNQSLTLNNSDILRKLFANSYNHFPTYRAANLLSVFSQAPLYFYEFSYKSSYSKHIWPDTKKPKGGVAHGDDLPYLFNIENDIYDDPDEFPIFTEKDPEILMVKRLTAIWINFAKTGEPLPKDPDLFGNITWEKFTPERRAYLKIEKDLQIKYDYLGDTMKFWDSLFP